MNARERVSGPWHGQIFCCSKLVRENSHWTHSSHKRHARNKFVSLRKAYSTCVTFGERAPHNHGVLGAIWSRVRAPPDRKSGRRWQRNKPVFPCGSSWERRRGSSWARACPGTSGAPRTCAWSSHPASAWAARSSAASSSRTSSGRWGCCRTEWCPVETSALNQSHARSRSARVRVGCGVWIALSLNGMVLLLQQPHSHPRLKARPCCWKVFLYGGGVFGTKGLSLAGRI